MSKRKYESIEELETAIEKYLKEQKKPTPRHFRAIGLGISKYTLSEWKHSPTKDLNEYYKLIKEAEDEILAKLEQTFSYGGKDKYNIAFTLRAYDNERYNPNYIKAIDATKQIEPVKIVLPTSIKEKGVQSEREIKLISKSS